MQKNLVFLVLSLVTIISLIMVGCSSTPSSTPPSSASKAAPPITSSAAPPPSTTAPASTTAKPSTSAPPSSSAAANIIKLKYADQNPDTGWAGSQAAQPWLKQVTAATNGRVQFDTYWSQTLFKGPDAWESLKNNVADVAWCFHGYWANVTPLADVVSLPFMPFTSAKQASGVLWQLYEKYPSIAAQFKDNHVLTIFGSQPHFLVTTKKQVKVMDDWQGMKVRVTAGPPVDMVKALGGTPVMMGMPDTYLSLQKGVLDGMLGPWEAFMSFRHYEVVKYYTYVPTVTVYCTISMSNKTWNSLPEDIKAQINSVSGLKGSEFWGENHYDTAMPAGRAAAQKAGYEMVEYNLPQEELNKWQTKVQPIWDAWVKAQTDAGHPEAKKS